MPSNMWLFCGDPALGTMAEHYCGTAQALLTTLTTFFMLKFPSGRPPFGADDMNSKLHEQMYMPQYRGPAGGPAATQRDPFRNVLHMMRTFFEGLAREPEWQGHEIVVFVDTNPAFTEYTQLALCESPALELGWWCLPPRPGPPQNAPSDRAATFCR